MLPLQLEGARSRRRVIAKVRQWLTAAYPRAFLPKASDRRIPLMLNISEAIAEESGVPLETVKLGVADYVRARKYQECLRSGEVRIDQHGNPVGVVTQFEEKWARIVIRREEQAAEEARAAALARRRPQRPPPRAQQPRRVAGAVAR